MAGLIVLLGLSAVGIADADQDRCSSRFPDVEWTTVEVDAPVSVATSGMAPEMAARFAADAARNANRIHNEIAGLDGVAVCLTTPEVTLDPGDLVAEGQRFHVGVSGEEKLFALSAVEIRFVADALAFGLPHIALYNLAHDIGLEGNYPEPLASTIGHWYLARDNGKAERYHSQLVVGLFLDNPNPEERTADEVTNWVGTAGEDPMEFDPKTVASPIGDLVDFAVRNHGIGVISDPSQETWAAIDMEWRTAMRDELLEGRQGSYGAEWGVAIVVVFILLAILLALQKRRQKKRAATKHPTPPVDESLFESSHS